MLVMLGMLAGHAGGVENNADDVDVLVACLALAKDQGQTEAGDSSDVALHPPFL